MTITANSADTSANRRSTALRRQQVNDAIFRIVTRASAIAVLLLLGGVMVSLVIGSWPVITKFGFGFLATETWNPVTEEFGALAAVYGTLITAGIAMLIGVPVSLGIAVFLTEICPPILRRPIGVAIELLAGIPSIIYGIWGLFVFAPVLQRTLQPWLIATFSHVPLLNNLFAGPPFGIGILTASL
ncbi:MAG TPA: phosphate ABC transporter permease subunit PstC, partial [Dongiaceae bacterium]